MASPLGQQALPSAEVVAEQEDWMCRGTTGQTATSLDRLEHKDCKIRISYMSSYVLSVQLYFPMSSYVLSVQLYFPRSSYVLSVQLYFPKSFYVLSVQLYFPRLSYVLSMQLFFQ